MINMKSNYSNSSMLNLTPSKENLFIDDDDKTINCRKDCIVKITNVDKSREDNWSKINLISNCSESFSSAFHSQLLKYAISDINIETDENRNIESNNDTRANVIYKESSENATDVIIESVPNESLKTYSKSSKDSNQVENKDSSLKVDLDTSRYKDRIPTKNRNDATEASYSIHLQKSKTFNNNMEKLMKNDEKNNNFTTNKRERSIMNSCQGNNNNNLYTFNLNIKN